MIKVVAISIYVSLGVAGVTTFAQEATPTVKAAATYTLGTGDELIVRVLDFKEIDDKPFLIDLAGDIGLPMAGRVHVAGMTVPQVEQEITRLLARYLQEPVVTVSVANYGSQPVSVLGAVTTPGTRQIRGHKTLVELLAEVGGIKPDAGNSVRITRRIDSGLLPLANATVDASGGFSVGEVGLKSLMEARDPSENIEIRPNDVVSVPRAELIYVVGSVRRSGGFPLNERESISVLQALAMAEGMERTAAPRAARILRSTEGSESRTEIAVDISKMLAGQITDAPLLPNDILFIPNSAMKSATLRSIEAVIQLGTGLAIWRR